MDRMRKLIRGISEPSKMKSIGGKSEPSLQLKTRDNVDLIMHFQPLDQWKAHGKYSVKLHYLLYLNNN